MGLFGNAFKSTGFDSNRIGNVFVIADGNGVVAFRVVQKLLESGYDSTVRVGVKDPTRSATDYPQLVEAGAHFVPFSWDDPETYAMAMAGGKIKSVFCALPHHVNWRDQFVAFLAAAKHAGVKNIVKLSFYHALASNADTMTNFATATQAGDPFLSIPLVLMHRECDAMLMKSAAFDYTILFATHFMSNPLVYQGERITKEQKFEGASHGKGVNYVSPSDVAEVAVRALLAPKDHHRTGYTLTGPEAIKDTEVAALLSKQLNKTIQYVDKPLRSFFMDTKDTDWGPVMDVMYLEHVKATGAEEDVGFVTKQVEKVCGHPPQTFAEYLADEQAMTPAELACLKS